MTVGTCDSGDAAVHGETGVLISPGDPGLQAAAGRRGGPVRAYSGRAHSLLMGCQRPCAHSKAGLRTRVLHGWLTQSFNKRPLSMDFEPWQEPASQVLTLGLGFPSSRGSRQRTHAHMHAHTHARTHVNKHMTKGEGTAQGTKDRIRCCEGSSQAVTFNP